MFWHVYENCIRRGRLCAGHLPVLSSTSDVHGRYFDGDVIIRIRPLGIRLGKFPRPQNDI